VSGQERKKPRRVAHGEGQSVGGETKGEVLFHARLGAMGENRGKTRE